MCREFFHSVGTATSKLARFGPRVWLHFILRIHISYSFSSLEVSQKLLSFIPNYMGNIDRAQLLNLQLINSNINLTVSLKNVKFVIQQANISTYLKTTVSKRSDLSGVIWSFSLKETTNCKPNIIN